VLAVLSFSLSIRKVLAMQQYCRQHTGRLALMLLVAGVAGWLGSARPSLAQEDADGTWLPLTIIYTSDIKGKIEPCG